MALGGFLTGLLAGLARLIKLLFGLSSLITKLFGRLSGLIERLLGLPDLIAEPLCRLGNTIQISLGLIGPGGLQVYINVFGHISVKREAYLVKREAPQGVLVTYLVKR